MVGLSLPVAGVKFTGVDAFMVPPGVSSRTVIDRLRSDFPHHGYRSSPATIVVLAGPHPPGGGRRPRAAGGLGGVGKQTAQIPSPTKIAYPLFALKQK